MEKIRTYWNSLTRPVKILYAILLVLLAGFLTYLALGAPPLTPMMGFRRAERANMVGPSQILDELTVKEYIYFVNRQPNRTKHPVIIAESQDCDIVYNFRSDTFSVYPKTQAPALYCVNIGSPKVEQTRIGNTVPLPLILFDRNEQAVRADIEFRIKIDDVWNNLFRKSALRQYNGFFYFEIIPENDEEAQSLSTFQRLFFDYDSADKPSITVMLYDKNGQLLSTETILPGPNLP